MNNNLAVRLTFVFVFKTIFGNKGAEVVDFAVTNKATVFDEKGLVTFRRLAINSKTMESPYRRVIFRRYRVI